jgi:hypothetical protein
MKLVLDNKDLADGFFEETRLLGIVAPMKTYAFVWQLNKVTGYDFRAKHDYEIELKRKERQYFFSVYEYPEALTSLVHYLYSNHYDGEYLLPEFKNLDFLWLLKGDCVSTEEITNLLDSIKRIPGVQLVSEISIDKIRNKEHMLF